MGEADRKQPLRRTAQTARAALADAAKRSQQALEHLRELPPYAAAQRVMHYVSVRSELATHDLIRSELALGPQEIYVPWCNGQQLELFRLHTWEDLVPGAFGILEPRAELRTRAERQVDLQAVELIVVPGVAFDRRGGRLGHGKGYYDRLLAQASQQTAFVGLCYECQLVEDVPRDEHDIAMRWLVTEAGPIACDSGPLT